MVEPPLSHRARHEEQADAVRPDDYDMRRPSVTLGERVRELP